MEVIVFESEAYEKMHREMISMMKKAIKEAWEEAMEKSDPANDWISSEEARKLLGIRSKTKMQELRDLDEIIYTKPKDGRIIRYSKRSILEYLNRYIQKPL
ncbi:helix-turn-helix domain-containing protein [Aquimarina sp. U1-2]|uniref:helix-turn-helix domain-containing protein n=1 Tax=Aquimarina sp. U1-2 TaxID=2823141 RepID=UPI001AECE5E5|nr:helix-turn-helix domain-containing protein [Aquimarina sp. U1-2]MBP2831243.1 helix-turn-helix domain-containing protein [Aquimarina sp. U1-2]